jgi:transcriptional regulator with XRE-family HTH domain
MNIFSKSEREFGMAGKAPNKTDVAVGERVREFRKDANLSQIALADQIGVTYQQVQKYENGINRIGAGRLTQIARALGVPITAFFDGLARPGDKRQTRTARLAELCAVPAAPKLLEAFSKISDPILAADVVNLVRALSPGGGR